MKSGYADSATATADDYLTPSPFQGWGGVSDLALAPAALAIRSDRMKRVVEVGFEQETLTVTYDRDALFRATAEHAPVVLAVGPVSHERISATVDALVEAIVSWDLADDDGRPYPIDRESFSQLPIYALVEIERAISADALASDGEM